MYSIRFFGWCNEDGHDKVWGWVEIGHDHALYNFWGRRGKRFTFKEHKGEIFGSYDVRKLIDSKMRPRTNGSYREIDPQDIEKIVPGFDNEFQNQFTLAKLFDKFHGKRHDEVD